MGGSGLDHTDDFP